MFSYSMHFSFNSSKLLVCCVHHGMKMSHLDCLSLSFDEAILLLLLLLHRCDIDYIILNSLDLLILSHLKHCHATISLLILKLSISKHPK